MKPTYRLYLIAVAAQLAAITMMMTLRDEVPASDPWYQWQAESLLNEGQWTVQWQDFNFAIQQGSYENWRPPLYSLLVTIGMVVHDSPVVLIVLQLLLYAFIPVLLYRVVGGLLSSHAFSAAFASLASLLWICNPQFLLSSVQILDSMLITLACLLTFDLLLRFRENGSSRYFFIACLAAAMFYLLRPTGILAFGVLLMIIGNRRQPFPGRQRFGILLRAIMLPVLLWGALHAVFGSGFHIGYTSSGYNLWLGNNKATLPFLRRTLGDAATIEDAVIGANEQETAGLSTGNEYEKNRGLRNMAFEYARTHPMETLEGFAWKILGFWSPFRQREGHYSQSWIKELVVLSYQLPLLLLLLVTSIRASTNSAFRKDRGIGIILAFIVLWMLPLLPFFTTPRFRLPVDPLLLYLAVLTLPGILAEYAKKALGAGHHA